MADKETTKDKILMCANELFARNGLHGTSVRDIANKAEVNLAAINYHFKNKQNLYWRVFDYNYSRMRQSLVEIGREVSTTAEFSVKVYKFFVKNNTGLINCFKIFLNENLNTLDNDLKIDEEERLGPPGQDVFLEKINKDLGPGYSLKDQRWAMSMIFSQIVHTAILMNTALLKDRANVEEELQPEYLEACIFHSATAQVEYLRSKRKLFS